MNDAVLEQIATALQSHAPVLERDQARELAKIAAQIVDKTDVIGSGLHICRVCRAPRKATEAS